MLIPTAATPPAAGPAPETATPTDTPPRWRYRIGEVVADGLDIGFTDRRADTPLSLRLAGSARAAGIQGGGEAPLAFSATLRAASGGELRLEGRAAQDGRNVEARLQLTDVELAPAAALVERHATVRLAGGSVGGDFRLRYEAGAPARLHADGRTQLKGLRINDAESGENLLAARRVDAEGELQLGPGRLLLRKVSVERPAARLIIDRERQLNLANLMRQRRAGQAEQGGAAAAAPRAEPAFALRIERIELHEGEVDFADYSLVLPFSTRVEALSGVVLGVDNRPQSEAVIDARGRIRPYGEARATGRIRPFAPAELTDLTVNFDNVEMPQLSPYSATFAGRTIAAGRLWLTVRYRVFDRVLDGNNAVTLQDFRLGERVEAPNALDLPLELALALLKDPDGRVHLEVPVRGNLGDAHFEYGQVVRDALGNVLRRVVTAPFRWLARLGGGGEDDEADAVAFEAGSARLSPVEEEKLQRLATALAQRPQLQLTVRGVHLAADEDALRREAARQTVAAAAGQPADATGPLDFGDAAVRRAVAERYEQSAGSAALAAFRRDFTLRKDGGGETALHRELFDRLAAQQPVSPGAPAKLARRRSEAVLAYLTANGLAAGRARAAAATAADDGPPRAELALGAGSGDTATAAPAAGGTVTP